MGHLGVKVKTQTFGMCRRGNNRWVVRPSESRGFTLLEILVVFAIAALIMSVMPFAFDKMRSSIQYRDSVRAIQSDLRLAREVAILEGVSTKFVIDVVKKNFGINGKTSHTIPDSVAIRAVVAQSEEGGQELSIYFMAAGGSTGGSIEVIRPNGDGIRLRVDWLSGRVSQEALLQ